MKFILTICLLLASPALADECLDRAKAVVAGPAEFQPTTSHLVSQVKGMAATENSFDQAAPGHTLVKMIVPDSGQWVLNYRGVAYQSMDEGATWTKLYAYDLEASTESGKALVAALAESARNAVCGTEALDGVMHETYELDTTNPEPYPLENHVKYWVEPDTRFVTRAETVSVGSGAETHTIQTSQPAPGLTLPLPE